MRIVQHGDRLDVSQIDELSARTSEDFGASFRDRLGSGVQEICVDLSGIGLLDCHGLGALVALRNLFHGRERCFQVVNASSSARRIFELSGLTPLLASDNSGDVSPQAGVGARPTLEAQKVPDATSQDSEAIAGLLSVALMQATRAATGSGV